MFLIRVLEGPGHSQKVYWKGKEKKCPFAIVCNFDHEKEYYENELRVMGCKYEVESVFENEYVEYDKNTVNIKEESRIGIEDTRKRKPKETNE